MEHIELYDKTLRDGAQSEGISFSVSDKLKIAEKLDELVIHFIEGGRPGANPKDMEFFKKVKALKFKKSKSVAFGSTRRAHSIAPCRRCGSAAHPAFQHPAPIPDTPSHPRPWWSSQKGQSNVRRPCSYP